MYMDDPLVAHSAATAGIGVAMLNGFDVINERRNTWDHPSLIFVGADDQLVNVKEVEVFYESIKSKDKTFFKVEASRHETLRDVNADMVKERIVEWITERSK